MAYQKITGIGVTDGDKGDVVVSGSGTSWALDYNAITLASSGTTGFLKSSDWTIFNNKSSTDTIYFLCFHGGALNPADSTSYYFGCSSNTIGTNATNVDFNIGYNCTLKQVVLGISSNTTPGSNENVTLQLRNTTQSTSTSIGTFQTNGSSATVTTNFTFTGLNISVASGDFICIQFDTPAYATNPINLAFKAHLYFTK